MGGTRNVESVIESGSVTSLYVTEKFLYMRHILLCLISKGQEKIFDSAQRPNAIASRGRQAETASIFKLCCVQVLCSCLQARGKIFVSFSFDFIFNPIHPMNRTNNYLVTDRCERGYYIMQAI